MAQKASKLLARRNAQRLNQTHAISGGVHITFIIFRLLLFRGSFTRTSLLLYVALSAPALAVEALFERGSRPTYTSSTTSGSSDEIRRPGDDLEAKGLTEWMWDVLYWTWACLVGAAVLGDRAWWCYSAVPAYSVWLAWSTYSGMRSGMGSLMGGASDGLGEASMQGQSKRAQKMEKRGAAQRVAYR